MQLHNKSKGGVILKFLDIYNALIGMLVTLLMAIFGDYWYIFVAFMIFNMLDWLTGWYKSRKSRTESSLVGLQGILKKLGYWVIIAVAFLDRKSTRLNSSHIPLSRMPSSS